MGTYQLYYIKICSGMAYLAAHAEDGDRETMRSILTKVMDDAKAAARRRGFNRSAYRGAIEALGEAAVAASDWLQRGDYQKMQETIAEAMARTAR